MELQKYSDYITAPKYVINYLCNDAKLSISTTSEVEKIRYTYITKNNRNTWVHFGQLGYDDYTKHKDNERRKCYLSQAIKIKDNERMIYIRLIIFK